MDQRRVILRAVINPRSAIPESNINNNEATADITFQRKQKLCFIMRRVRTHAGVYEPGFEDFWHIIARAESMLPTSDVLVSLEGGVREEPCYGIGGAFGCTPEFEFPGDAGYVLFLLGKENTLSWDPEICRDNNARGHRVGMIHPSTTWGSTNGQAPYAFNVAIVKMRAGQDRVGDGFDLPKGGVTPRPRGQPQLRLPARRLHRQRGRRRRHRPQLPVPRVPDLQ